MSANGYINEKPCDVRFDTGSEVTLMSQKFFQSLNLDDEVELPRCQKIKAVNNESISLIGQVRVSIKFNEITFPIIAQIVPMGS